MVGTRASNRFLSCAGFLLLLMVMMVTAIPVKAQSRPSTMQAVERAERVWDPLTRFIQELNDDVFFHTPSSFFPLWRRPSDLTVTTALSSFKVDVIENDKAYTVRADVPGVSKDDIKITCEGDNLVISAERKDSKEEKDETRHVSEVVYGKIYRSFRLPADSDADKIEAKYDKGVLTVTLPKRDMPKEKVIEIKTA